LNFSFKNTKIAVIGQGYVGLPLAVEFGKHYPTLGFDINATRIEQLGNGIDLTQEMSAEQLTGSAHLKFSANTADLAQANVYIVTVPTPIDEHKKPDLSPLKGASKMLAQVLKKGDVVIYESTVYPGCTEEDCVPLLEQGSGLKYNQDFFCGYSPERIVPGDKERTLTKIRKITSGSTEATADFVDQLYGSIITAGTYKAPSIKVAEAAKVIENCQRDLNISFVNELALIFDRLNLDTTQVLEAAGTKFNFLPFKPGLVGGHCISVDPYYLTSKAESVGYFPEVIHSGRRINDNMGAFIASKVVKLMIAKNQPVKGAKVLVLGITFKENCPDLRNSKVIDVIRELQSYGVDVDVVDPHAQPEEVEHEYNIQLNSWADLSAAPKQYAAVILAVSHKEFIATDIRAFQAQDAVLYDVKAVLPHAWVDGRL
jgi:UDP-N-acetyl-D-glucosamine/UDP-N-acetyl-D-galactosamine dehydrogenase